MVRKTEETSRYDQRHSDLGRIFQGVYKAMSVRNADSLTINNFRRGIVYQEASRSGIAAVRRGVRRLSHKPKACSVVPFPAEFECANKPVICLDDPVMPFPARPPPEQGMTQQAPAMAAPAQPIRPPRGYTLAPAAAARELPRAAGPPARVKIVVLRKQPIQ
jgi:hypothetical protein